MITLRSCAAGGGHWSGHNSPSFGGVFLCPLHQWSLMHGFDPRPAGQGGTDSRVKLISGTGARTPLHAERYEPEYVVLARDGDLLVLRNLGRPDLPDMRCTVAEVYPASPGAVYRHASRCGPASAVPR